MDHLSSEEGVVWFKMKRKFVRGVSEKEKICPRGLRKKITLREFNPKIFFYVFRKNWLHEIIVFVNNYFMHKNNYFMHENIVFIFEHINKDNFFALHMLYKQKILWSILQKIKNK